MAFPKIAADRLILVQSLRLALQALFADKLKTALTMLAVVVGSAAIVLVVTIASAGKLYIVAQIEGIGANLAYATLDRNDALSVVEDELTPGDLEATRQFVPAINAIAGTYDIPVDFQIRGNNLHARLVGVTQDFQKIRRLRITSGRYFDAQDFRARSKVCSVSDHLAQLAFGLDSPLGRIVQLDQFRCTVIGTFKEGVPTFGQSEIQDQTLVVPFPLVKEIVGDNFFQVLYVQAISPKEVPAVAQRLDALLRSRHRKAARYSVQNLSAILETVERVSLAMSGILIGIAVITLLIAGTGIMNIMLFNVAQRTHEIGLRKALGATPAEIRLQFLLEAVVISFAGSAIGVVMAMVVVWSTAGLVENMVKSTISWTGVAVAVIASGGIGLLFGYSPARQAANLNPVDALRVE
jgi:putative ABC transport system permease protein